MTQDQVAALQGVVVTALAALIAGGVIDPGLSDALTAVVVAVFTGIGAFLVHPVGRAPRDG